MTDHPIDFSPLDPRRDPDRFDGLIRHVVEQGLPRPATGLPWGLSLLFGPALAASLAMILLFGALSVMNLRESGAGATNAQTPTEFAFGSWAVNDADAEDGGLEAWQDLEMLRR